MGFIFTSENVADERPPSVMKTKVQKGNQESSKISMMTSLVSCSNSQFPETYKETCTHECLNYGGWVILFPWVILLKSMHLLWI